MIRVQVGRNAQNVITGFRASGHSGYAQHGQDIVCAGVSAVTLTAVLGIEQYLKLPMEAIVNEETGLLECSFGDEVGSSRCAQAILETMIIGLEAMEEEYSQYLRVENVTF